MRLAYKRGVQDETIANVLGALAQALTDRVQQAVSDATGQPQAAATLVHLSKYGGEPIDALRQPLRLSHPGCVRVVDRLEERRLVARREGEDRRARSLHLTQAGARAAKAVLARRQAVLMEALATLTPAERRTLGRLAGKILGALVEDEAQALAVCRLCDYGVCHDDLCPVERALAERSA